MQSMQYSHFSHNSHVTQANNLALDLHRETLVHCSKSEESEQYLHDIKCSPYLQNSLLRDGFSPGVMFSQLLLLNKYEQLAHLTHSSHVSQFDESTHSIHSTHLSQFTHNTQFLLFVVPFEFMFNIFELVDEYNYLSD